MDDASREEETRRDQRGAAANQATCWTAEFSNLRPALSSITMVLRTPSDVELPPRATLPSLPLEVKARIVQLAYEQDCNFEERVKEAAPVELDMGTLLSSKWHGRSTNALLLTNHEFSGLAAKYVFKVRPNAACMDRGPNSFCRC